MAKKRVMEKETNYLVESFGILDTINYLASRSLLLMPQVSVYGVIILTVN